jgi:hypothetical protein
MKLTSPNLDFANLTKCWAFWRTKCWAFWRNDWLTKWLIDKNIGFQNVWLVKWPFVKNTSWQKNRLTKWTVEKMTTLNRWLLWLLDKMTNRPNGWLMKWHCTTWVDLSFFNKNYNFFIKKLDGWGTKNNIWKASRA